MFGWAPFYSILIYDGAIGWLFLFRSIIQKDNLSELVDQNKNMDVVIIKVIKATVVLKFIK